MAMLPRMDGDLIKMHTQRKMTQRAIKSLHVNIKTGIPCQHTELGKTQYKINDIVRKRYILVYYIVRICTSKRACSKKSTK